MTAADCNAPVVNRRVRGRSLPWITPTIKDVMKKHDYHHKKAIKTNKELHWSSYKRLRDAVLMKFRKEKASYSNQLCEIQDWCKLWKTLNELLPNKKQHKSANAPTSENLMATNFYGFSHVTSAEKLCGHYKSKTRLADILTPKSCAKLCSSKGVNFVLKELSKQGD